MKSHGENSAIKNKIMIPTKELRLGNLVNSRTNEFAKVVQIGHTLNPDYVGARTIDKGYYVTFCNPIPLSEEILLKCGFEKYAGWFILKSIYTHLDININLLINKLTIGRNEDYEIDRFKSHLHELQNLYFALTGEELKIDL